MSSVEKLEPAIEELLLRQLPLWQKNNKSTEEHFTQYAERLRRVLERLADATVSIVKLQAIIEESRQAAHSHGHLLEKLSRRELPSSKVDELIASATKQGLSPQLLADANASFFKVKQTAEEILRCVDGGAHDNAASYASSPRNRSVASRGRTVSGGSQYSSRYSSTRSLPLAPNDLRFDDLEAGYLSGRGFSIGDNGKRAAWGKYRGAIVCEGRIGSGVHAWRFKLSAGDWEHAAFGVANGPDCVGGLTAPYAFWWGSDVHVKLTEEAEEKVTASSLTLASLAVGDIVLVTLDRPLSSVGKIAVRVERTGETQTVEFEATSPVTPCFAMWKGVVEICEPPAQHGVQLTA